METAIRNGGTQPQEGNANGHINERPPPISLCQGIFIGITILLAFVKLPIVKGDVLDEVKGQWTGVNEAVHEHTHRKLERFNAYTMMEDPMTSCGCFECIVAMVPEANGVMVINMLKSTFFEPEDTLAVVKTAARHSGKPVVDVPAGGEDFALVQRVLRNTSMPVYNLPEKAAGALRVLRLYGKVKEKGVEV